MADVLPPRGDDDAIDHHQANYVYPPRPRPGPESEPALSWRPHPAILARAPPFPFLSKAGPVPGSFWAVPGLLMCGPDPRWERRGALARLEYDFRIAEVVSDDVVVQARNLAPHLVEGPPIYVCGRGSRALAAYLLAQLYDLPLALACVDLERLMGVYLRGSEWGARFRACTTTSSETTSAMRKSYSSRSVAPLLSHRGSGPTMTRPGTAQKLPGIGPASARKGKGGARATMAGCGRHASAGSGSGPGSGRGG